MKTRISSVLILAAALSASALVPMAAAPAQQGVVPMAYSVRSVDHLGYVITRGTSTLDVLQWLGAPHRKPSSDTWVYYGYHADFAPANDQQCSTLVLTIARGDIVDIQLVNKQAAQLIANS